MSTRIPCALPVCVLLLAAVGCGDRIGQFIADLETSSDAATRRAAIRALAAEKPPSDRIVSALAKAVADADIKVRLAAITALGAYGPKAMTGLPALREALNEREATIRTKAALAIAHINRDEARSHDVL